MKKIMRYLLLTMLALFMSVPGLASAEAAGILLLPVINKAENTNPEVISQIYYQEAMEAIRNLPDYEMVNSDDLDNIKEMPTKEEMIALAKSRRAEMVICFQLDNLDYTSETHNGDRYAKLDLQGYCVSYEASNGKYIRHRIMDDKMTEEEATNRWDWTGEEWSKAVRSEMNRIMKNKKIKIAAPRMGSLK